MPRSTPKLLEHDPYNRLLARGPRFRLDAEMIRDNALAVSGLLNDTLGGPSVSPYQPAGLWDEADLRRPLRAEQRARSLPPRHVRLLEAFDPLSAAGDVRRAQPRGLHRLAAPRTNTPLQALVLLNDPAYVEAARVLAERILKEGGSDVPARIAFAFELCTARAPSEREATILRQIFERNWPDFASNPAAAAKLISVGESPARRRHGPGRTGRLDRDRQRAVESRRDDHQGLARISRHAT